MFPLIKERKVRGSKAIRIPPSSNINSMPASDPLCSSNDTPGRLRETKAFGFGEYGCKVKLKGIDGGSPPVRGLRFNLTQSSKPSMPRTRRGIDD
ncbi:hypothetical protein JTE90_017855 [Oedothorax gibbosus]|uniref:Uncharacterized protein n=1 Tax=Oedothorax gibbosus TaxID=931172 RepID=A0AAV6TGC8_9ARAC|nr:hypothetical protein JTE90_017855 [Oedothorax gibbosus]